MLNCKESKGGRTAPIPARLKCNSSYMPVPAGWITALYLLIHLSSNPLTISFLCFKWTLAFSLFVCSPYHVYRIDNLGLWARTLFFGPLRIMRGFFVYFLPERRRGPEVGGQVKVA
jgi:hypothetical protein